MPRRAVGWAEPVRRVMTSLQPPLLRQPDGVAAVAWEPGFLYLKSAASGARCLTGGSMQNGRSVFGGDLRSLLVFSFKHRGCIHRGSRGLCFASVTRPHQEGGSEQPPSSHCGA